MSAFDLSLVERDPDLAGLRLFLEPQLLADWLAEQGAQEGPAELTYLRYKPGTSVTAALTIAGEPAFAYAVAPGALPKIEKLLRRAPSGSVLAYDSRQRVLVARPRADRDLPGLRSMATEVETLAYKPQRRWVGLVGDDSAGPASSVVRCYRPSDAAAARERWPTAGGPVVVPEVRRFDRRCGTLRIERLPGRRLTSLSGPAQRDAWLRTGRMLGLWHRDAGPAPSRADLPDLGAVAAQIAWLLPDQRERVAQLVERLADGDATTDTGWCHGDFSADQVLIDDDGEPALLDWDRSGFAPRAADLASADLVGSGAEVDAAARQWEALLTGYTEIRPAPPALDQARARSYFLRAAEPFRHAEDEWPQCVRSRLDRVEELAWSTG